jgi:hypothetical protein
MGRALAEDALARSLTDAVEGLLQERALLGDALGALARRLTPADPAWQPLRIVLDGLYGSGVHALGRPRFVTDALLQLLRDEARDQRPEVVGARRPAPGAAGPALAALAVSAQLRYAVSTALGHAVAPTYDAVYLYDPPGSHVRTHVDTRDYELVVHLVLEHALPRKGRGSALVAHLPGEPEPRRLAVPPGEAVVLRGRGTIHSWEQLADDEDRTMIAVGFASSR